MSSDRKLVYTLKAVYEGKGEIKQLQGDLNELKKIEAFQGMQESFNKTTREFVDAKAKLRELRQAMKQPGGEAFAESYRKAKKEVNNLAKSVDRQKTEMNEARTSLQKAGIAVGDLAGRYKTLKSSSEKTSKILAAQMKLGIKPVQDVEREVKGLEQAYKDLERSGKFSTRELAGMKAGMQQKVVKLRSETLGWRDNLAKVEQGWIGIAGIVATVAAASQGVKFYANFDDSMRSVKAVSGATKEEYRQLTEFAKKMGTTTRFTATQAAAGMEELAQSGMSVNEIMSTLPQAMNLASISGGTIKESADLLTDTLKQFGLEVKNTGRVSDVLVQGYTGASTSLDQLGKALSYAGPIAASMGYSLEDTVAILDALAEAGFKGSRGGTALVGGMTRLVKPSKEAAAILEKYSINVFDAEGKVRNFADIIEELGEAALNPTEMMELFGQEAGPGMAGLLGQGADAIRNFQKDLEGVNGVAEKIASDKEDGIGGALRSLGSSLQAIVLAFTDSWAPAIKLVAELLTGLARLIAEMPTSMKLLISGVGLAVAGFATWHMGLRLIFTVMRAGVKDVLSLGGKIQGLGQKSALAAKSMKLIGRVFALWAAWDIGYTIGIWLNQFDVVKKAGIALAGGLTTSFLKIKKAWAWVIGGNTDAVQKEIEQAEKIYAKMFAEVGKDAKESGAVQKQAHEEVTESARKAAAEQKQAATEALEEMKEKYRSYVDEVKRLQDEISGREKSLARELREMNRTGKTERFRIEDLKKEGEEYVAKARELAKRAQDELAKGNEGAAKELFQEAVQYADDAKQAFKQLGSEGGAKVLETAMNGVKKSGELAINILKQQETAVKETAAAMNEASGGALLADLKKDAPEVAKMFEGIKGQTEDLAGRAETFNQEWQKAIADFLDNGVKSVDKLERKLALLEKDRRIRVVIDTVQNKKTGGPIIPGFAFGGHVWSQFKRLSSPFITRGSGLRDDVPAMLTRNEYVQPEPAVKYYGVGFMEAIRRRMFPRDLARGFNIGGLVDFRIPPLPPLPRQFADGGSAQPAAA